MKVLIHVTPLFIIFFTSLVFVFGLDHKYESMHHVGKGHKIIPNVRHVIAASRPRGQVYFGLMNAYAFPEPLPKEKRSHLDAMSTPYENQYQGRRIKGDQRVYTKKFNYPAHAESQIIICRGETFCTITHLAITSEGGIPMILRGGAGYEYFNVVVKSKPGGKLVGAVKAYCMKHLIS